MRTLTLAVALCCAVAAQEPAPPTPAPDAGKPTTSDALRHAFVDATAARPAIHAAATQVHKSGPAGRTKFMATLRAVAATAPRSAPTPGGDAGKSEEFAEEVRSLMAEVATGTREQCQVALGKLAQLGEAGTRALVRLQERGNVILQRCILNFVRAKLDSNTLFAGQYAELRDYEPEAHAILLSWVKSPPREVGTSNGFRTACLRALRDVVPGEQATDAMRNEVRAVLERAQQAKDNSMTVIAACALHQFGDTSAFDAIKARFEQRAASDVDAEKLVATDTLASLHYQLRKYDVAATHYAATVEMMVKVGREPGVLKTACYNTACCLSLAGKTDDAFSYLEKALQYGSQTGGSPQAAKAQLDEDHDLDNLRSDSRWKLLLEQHLGGAQGAR